MIGIDARPSVVVFCGPSITAEQVTDRVQPRLAALEPPRTVICRPPAAQGDVIRAVRDHSPHSIGIIDGVFERVASVWHKEILWAMDGGTHVFGSSSMGALRAAECHRFGMVGVGRVFEQFRDGHLVDDDEVAVVHGAADDGYRPLSTAMVDLRALFEAAASAGTITANQAAMLTSVAKSLPYPRRALPTVLREATREGAPAALPPEVAAVVTAYAAAHGPGQKHLDAVALLDVLVDHLTTDPEAFDPDGWWVEPTVFLSAAIHEVDRGRTFDPNGNPDPNPDPDYGALSGETEAVLRKQALLRILAREVATTRGIRLGADDLEQTVHNFRDRYDLTDDAILLGWLASHEIEWKQCVDALTDIALVDRVERTYRLDVDAAVAPLARFAGARRARAMPRDGDG